MTTSVAPSRRTALCLSAAALTCALLAGTGCIRRRPPVGATTTTATTTTTTARRLPPTGSGLLDSTEVHDVAVTFKPEKYDEIIAEYVATGDKKWMKATVTIDGVTYEDVGMRLKGNSSLSGLGRLPGGPPGGFPLPEGVRPPGGGPGGFGPGGGATKETPELLPWLIRLDRNVEGQSHEGITEFAVRSNPTKSSLNEQLALDLLWQTGLASQSAAPSRFTVNGQRRALRLLSEVPNDEWDAARFDGPGYLYKAESGGDYSYRGDDPAAYDEIFDQEAGGEDDLAPLIDFLKFINQSSDQDFAAQLPQRLDVPAFADYLAFEDLIGNWDDIEGPGNNSYLRFTRSTGQMTVVAWDHNLALGAMGGMGGMPPFGGGGGNPFPFPFPTTTTTTGGSGGPPTTLPAPGPTTTRPAPPGGGGFRFPRENQLVKRFKAVPGFKAAYDASTTRLRATLFGDGNAETLLQRRADVLRQQAGELVDAATLDRECSTIRAYFKTG